MTADALSATLFAIADPTRRRILERLAIGEATVGELAEPFAMSFAAVSKHVKVLEAAGLISRGREAQWRPCRLEPTPLASVSAWIDSHRELWERNLDSLGDYLKRLQPTRKRSPR